MACKGVGFFGEKRLVKTPVVERKQSGPLRNDKRQISDKLAIGGLDMFLAGARNYSTTRLG